MWEQYRHFRVHAKRKRERKDGKETKEINEPEKHGMQNVLALSHTRIVLSFFSFLYFLSFLASPRHLRELQDLLILRRKLRLFNGMPVGVGFFEALRNLQLLQPEGNVIRTLAVFADLADRQ